MKICVFSDSHGNILPMLEAIKKHRPDMVIHLGDGKSDVERISSRFSQITLKAVRGNCDLGSGLPEQELLNINGVKILLTHGHAYSVKHGFDSLLFAGRSAGASLILYGHTHIAQYKRFGPIDTLNPGSCGLGFKRSFAEVNISDSGEYTCNIVTL